MKDDKKINVILTDPTEETGNIADKMITLGDTNTEMVACPSCKGTKLSPFDRKNPCLCCNGEGKISQMKEKKLNILKGRISQKAYKKGIDI